MQRDGLEQRTEPGHSAGSPESLPALPAARCADKSLAFTSTLTSRLLTKSCWFCFTAPLKSGCWLRPWSAQTTSLLPSLLMPSCPTRLSKMLLLKHLSGISPVPLLHPPPFTWSILQSTGLVWSSALLLPECFLSFLCNELFLHPVLWLSPCFTAPQPAGQPPQPAHCFPERPVLRTALLGWSSKPAHECQNFSPALELDVCSHCTVHLLNINFKHCYAGVKYNYTHKLGKNGWGAVCSIRISCTPKLQPPQQPQIWTDSVMTGQIILPT